MPRKALFTREEMLARAFELVRRNGMESLTARELGAALGCSPRPIFTLFQNMEDLKNAVVMKAREYFSAYVADVVNYQPAFKEYGRRLCYFGKNDPNLFRLVFLNCNAKERYWDDTVNVIMKTLAVDYDLTPEQALILLEQTNTFVCGMAMFAASGAEDYDEERLDTLLSRSFISTLMLLKNKNPLPVMKLHELREGEERITLPLEDYMKK